MLNTDSLAALRALMEKATEVSPIPWAWRHVGDDKWNPTYLDDAKGGDVLKPCDDGTEYRNDYRIEADPASQDFIVALVNAAPALLAAAEEAANRPVTFPELRRANVLRNSTAFPQCEEWSLTDWACALAGEVGEACNLIKKHRRGDKVDAKDIGKELADVVVYADLLASRIGIDLGAAIVDKFNEVSTRVGSNVHLSTSPPVEVEGGWREKCHVELKEKGLPGKWSVESPDRKWWLVRGGKEWIKYDEPFDYLSKSGNMADEAEARAALAAAPPPPGVVAPPPAHDAQFDAKAWAEKMVQSYKGLTPSTVSIGNLDGTLGTSLFLPDFEDRVIERTVNEWRQFISAALQAAHDAGRAGSATNAGGGKA